MKNFTEFLAEEELKTKIDKVSGCKYDGWFLVMKWSERGKFYPDGKPFKTEKEAKQNEKALKLKVTGYDRVSKAWKKAHSSVPIRKFHSN